MRPPMTLKTFFLLGVGTLCWIELFAGDLAGQQRFPFSRVTSNDESVLKLTEKAGPWLIMVTSFSGEEGEQQAKRLAMELQTRHKLKAYTHVQEFNFELESKGVGYRVVELANNEKVAVPSVMNPANPTSFQEHAVLVGDFPSIEDPKAQRTLEMVKKLQPESLAQVNLEEALYDEELPGGRVQAMRAWLDSDRGKEFRPLRSAFLMANPLLPDEYFAARRIDKTILDLNSGLKYSLLNCPGDYSVKVASFTGSSTMVQSEMEKIRQEEQLKKRNKQSITDSKLADAAKKATLLTIELRRQGYEAYEFHDRFESYVCVGSFDWVTEEDKYGRQRINPEIEKTIATFKGQDVASGIDGQNNKTLSGKTFPLPAKFLEAGISCDVQPLPVMIPKKENARFAAKLFERFK
jgi:hypothetical protein